MKMKYIKSALRAIVIFFALLGLTDKLPGNTANAIALFSLDILVLVEAFAYRKAGNNKLFLTLTGIACVVMLIIFYILFI